MPDDPTATTPSPHGHASNGGAPSEWDAPPPLTSPQVRAVRALEQAEVLDGPAGALANVIKKAVPSGPIKDALSGTWLGHPLHPLLTDVVIGTWLSALLLDGVGGADAEDGADRLIGIGLVAALPTAASGASDWADAIGKERRVGFVHALANYTALGLYGASLAARRSDRRGAGKALSVVGGVVLGISGYLGGHLSYSRGVGVDETVFLELPQDWTPALAESDVPADGSPTLTHVGEVAVLVSRQDGGLAAIANRCSHRGGPLDEGEASGDCVTCPWHGSKFSLVDGSVLRGPATAPQPAFDVRVRDGQVEVRAAPREVA